MNKAVRKRLLGAAVDQCAEIRPAQSPAHGGLARDTSPKQTAKRQLDPTSEYDCLPAKRARLTPPAVQPSEIEEVERTGEEINRQDPEAAPPDCPDDCLTEPEFEREEQVTPARRLRSRQTDSEDEYEEEEQRELKRARLTRKNLARFNKMARKHGVDKPSASATPNSTIESGITKTTSTTSSGFVVRARNNGILDPLHSKPPKNLEEIQEQHARSRATASPPESRFKRYTRTASRTCNESTMLDVVSKHILKDFDDDGYERTFNQAFTAFPKNVGFNNGLSAPQPDFVEGFETEEYRPFPIGDHIPGAILYKDNPYSVTLPHLAGEWNGPDGKLTEATLQSGYDGAALVYARNQALSLIGKPDPEGHAVVRTFTTDGTNINFYAHYAARSEENGTLEYHQYQ